MFFEMKKMAVIKKLMQDIIKITEDSNKELNTVFTLLILGSGSDVYITFLKDKNKAEFQDEESILSKKNDLVTIEINDYLFPGHPSFTTTQVNLLNILKEWRRLKELQPDRIELVLEDDVLTMKGDWEK